MGGEGMQGRREPLSFSLSPFRHHKACPCGPPVNYLWIARTSLAMTGTGTGTLILRPRYNTLGPALD